MASGLHFIGLLCLTSGLWIGEKMVSDLHFIGLLCLTSGLWIGANAQSLKGPGSGTCPSGWTTSGRRCFLFQLSEKDWADAEYFCTSLGGNLASLQTPDDYAFIRDLILRATNSQKASWVGGYDEVKNGVWLWSDGSKFVFNNWGKGEPNNSGGGEGCMEMNFRGQDYVNDEKCNQRRSFVCARNQ
ncbi:galactose-specific lectin nattectin-like [Micropterus dolomieu]|uniref:galactose-specific lectin nattectin-like n=1 Tax=Micropterus dolomieu TaxID=147949 RepID=UPI001E8DD7EC|nr:galactose-specific lectin nattectin-like [Micropterus dolomieu]